jgi:hypothetical protein
MRPGSSTEAGAQPIHSLAFRVGDPLYVSVYVSEVIFTIAKSANAWLPLFILSNGGTVVVEDCRLGNSLSYAGFLGLVVFVYCASWILTSVFVYLFEQVMRLCRPSIQIENPLKFFPEDLDPAHQEGDADDLADVPFKNRTNMTDTTEAFGIGGMMVLPQSFG